jgi:peptide/nickel transport system substrate-binding protein
MKQINRRQFIRWTAGGMGALSVFGPIGRGYAKDAEQILRVQLPSSLNSIDPAFEISAGDEGKVSILVSNALLRYAEGKEFKLRPDLATSWTASEGGKVYTFKLRERVKWHKGYGEFTAEDVKFSYERIMNPETRSPNAGSFREIEKIDVVDKYTVRFTLKAPSAIFPHNVATFRGGFLMSKAAADKLGAEVGKKLIGTGPFMLEKAVLDQEIVLKRNDEFFGEKPRLETITFKVIREPGTANLAFEREQLDIIDINEKESVDRYQKNPKYKFLASDASTGFYLITFNTRKKPFDDVKVRKAFQYAIDKKAISDAVYGARGRTIDTVVPPGVSGFTDDVAKYPHDVDKAKKLLEEAGYGKGFKAKLTVPATNEREGVLLQSQLARVGVTLDLQMIDRPTWFKSLAGTDHDILFNAHFRPPLANAFLFVSYHSANAAPKGVNCAFYDKADDLIDRARTTFDEKEQSKLYAEALRRIADDSPAIPLVQEMNTFVAQKYVKNVETFRVPENAPVLEKGYIEK